MSLWNTCCQSRQAPLGPQCTCWVANLCVAHACCCVGCSCFPAHLVCITCVPFVVEQLHAELQMRQEMEAAKEASAADGRAAPRLSPSQVQRLKERSEQLVQRRLEAATQKQRQEEERIVRTEMLQEQVQQHGICCIYAELQLGHTELVYRISARPGGVCMMMSF